jgi:hypothetical protein
VARARCGQRARPLAAAGQAALIAAATAVIAGCVSMPTGGAVRSSVIQAGTGQGQDYIQPDQASPGQDWTPKEIVSGFLNASASFAGEHAVAREYLTPAASSRWQPGWSVTVFGGVDGPDVALAPDSGTAGTGTTGTGSKASATVAVTGTVLANLNGSGQYVTASGAQAEKSARPKEFTLVKVDGQWRISRLPANLLLTESDFSRVYQPRDLYFFDPAKKVLVPEPVFVPLEATRTDLVNGLVNALASGPGDWLSGATTTAFPPGTKLLTDVTLDGSTATVNLGGAAAKASAVILQEICAQLLWTLAGSSQYQPSIQSVALEINNQPRTLSGSQVQSAGSYQSYVPIAPAPATWYYTNAHGAVLKLTGAAAQGIPVPGQAGTGHVPLKSIAVAPDGQYVAGLSADGTTVYVAALKSGAVLTRRLSGGRYTSLSWSRNNSDGTDDLWVAGNDGISMLDVQDGVAVQVAVGSGADPVTGTITSLRVAPDGVRVAMIVRNGASSQLMLGAIVQTAADSALPSSVRGKPVGGQQVSIPGVVSIGPSAANFTSLTWYNADNLMALNETSAGPVPTEVPVNGSAVSPSPAVSGATSLTAAGAVNAAKAASSLVVGLPQGKLGIFTTLGQSPSMTVDGLYPAYPG